MHMRGRTGCTTTLWIHAVQYILHWEVVVVERQWQLLMLMILGIVQSHTLHQTETLVASVHSILQQALLQVTFAGTSNLSIVHSGKAALVMVYWRYLSTSLFLSNRVGRKKWLICFE